MDKSQEVKQRMVSLCSAHHDALTDIHFGLEIMLRSRDLRSTVDFDLSRLTYAYLDVC